MDQTPLVSRLNALVLTDTPPAENVRMLPAVPLVALEPEKLNVLAGALPRSSATSLACVGPHFAGREDAVVAHVGGQIRVWDGNRRRERRACRRRP